MLFAQGLATVGSICGTERRAGFKYRACCEVGQDGAAAQGLFTARFAVTQAAVQRLMQKCPVRVTTVDW